MNPVSNILNITHIYLSLSCTLWLCVALLGLYILSKQTNKKRLKSLPLLLFSVLKVVTGKVRFKL